MEPINKEDIKNKASRFISLVTGMAEKTIHNIVDKGAEVSSTIEKTVLDAYQDLSRNLTEWMDKLQEKEVSELNVGDLVVSPVDIFIKSKLVYPMGTVFEFNPEEANYIKTPLFLADVKAAFKYGRLKEAKTTNEVLTKYQNTGPDSKTVPRMLEYLEFRIKSFESEEKAHHETTS